MASIIINLAAAIAAFCAVAVTVRRNSLRSVMKFFTAQSNVFCAAACLAVAVFRLLGFVPKGVLIWKYSGTVAVTVTLLTVFLFLSRQYGLKPLLAGYDLWLHLVCPLLALVSYFAWDQPEMPFSCVFLGLLPILLCAVLYLFKVILERPEKRWEDFYGFNKDGKWPVSFLAMLVSSFILCVLLWAL